MSVPSQVNKYVIRYIQAAYFVGLSGYYNANYESREKKNCSLKIVLTVIKPMHSALPLAWRQNKTRDKFLNSPCKLFAGWAK